MPEIIRYSRFRVPADIPPSTAFPTGHEVNYPLVDLKLKIGKTATPAVTAFIDSGSAYCIFGSQAADLLGLNVRSGKLRSGIHGVGGTVDLYFFDVELLFDSLRIGCYAGFMDQEFPGNAIHIGLLGDQGFLSKVPVALDTGKLQIRIG